jgi:hypothetical protein
VVVAGEDYELGVGEVLGQVTASAHLDEPVSLTMHDQRGNRDGGEERPNILLKAGPGEAADLIRSSPESGRTGPPGSEALVGDPAGGEEFELCGRGPPLVQYGDEALIEMVRRKTPGVVVIS